QDRIYRYFDTNPQLHVLFIFDKFLTIQTELASATWKDGYVYKVFEGSWFSTKYAIENTWKDKKVVLLFNTSEFSYPDQETSQANFPLLDVLRANMVYKDEDYASFMQQHNLPQSVATFVKKHIGELMTNKVNAILGDSYQSDDFTEDVGYRGLITSYLGEKKLLDWDGIIIRLIILGGGDEKKRNEFFSRIAKVPDVENRLSKKLMSIFGQTFEVNDELKVRKVAESLKYNAITQLFDAIPADDYKSLKVTNSIALEQMNKIYSGAVHDRNLSEKFTDAMKVLAKGIKEEEIIKCYGVHATYLVMTDALCWPILKEMIEKDLLADPDNVTKQMRELSLKMSATDEIQKCIRLVEQMSLYYAKVKSIETVKLNTLDEYAERYTSDFYLVDMLYRRCLEAYHEVNSMEGCPILETAETAKAHLDQDYAKFTNVLNLEWMACVKENGLNFDHLNLPKQEDFFQNENDTSVKQCVIICDALRYEVAAELMQELAKKKHVAELSAMRAMLPTETKFCKPALLPHHELTLNGVDMLVDGKLLTTAEDRTEHVNHYREKAVCVNFDYVMNGHTKEMRELFKQHDLVYIFHNAIDEAGHSQSPFEVINACRTAIEQLAVLIPRIHASWNVNNILVTSDHGFIYNDMQFEEKDKHSITEEAMEKKTRYYLTTSNAPVDGIVKFPLSKVSGIKDTVGIYVAVPEGTNRMAASGGYNFAHGGATLQEMIIPFIHSTLKKKEVKTKVDVALLNHNLTMVSSMLRLQIIQSEAVSMNVKERRIRCCVYDGDQPVTQEKMLTLNSPDAENINNRLFSVTLTLNKPVSSSLLQLRIYDVDDSLNPILKETVKNSTLIEQDF
ncbi:MAG: BREX-1 system phosphatase PglZ type A, partial [Prevotella sp.]